MTFRLVQCNLQQTDKGNEQGSIATVTNRADVATWNEARDAHAALDALRGWSTYVGVGGGIAVSFRTNQFVVVAHGTRMVMPGGRIGGRRRGPSRAVVWVVLEENATQRQVTVATHHAIAKAFTDNRWRKPLWTLGIRNVAAELRRVIAKHPDAGLLLTGDLNSPGPISFGIGETEVNTPATFGRNRYDRLFRRGAVRVSTPTTFATHSDHRALEASVSLTDEAPAPQPAGPVGPPPKGRPLSPWRRYTRRWRRRHPRRWRRIVRRWRRNHRRP